MLTAERLRELFDYDPETGLLISRQQRGPLRVGTPIGSVRTDGYVGTRVDRRYYKVHRLVWLYVNGEWPDRDIDHANGNRSDNRIANLRLATDAQNAANAKTFETNQSGLKGVTRNAGCITKPWRARIMDNGTHRTLGSFATPDEAHAAYMAEARRIHGEFARAA